MKKLVIIPLLLMLSGCVSYYYPVADDNLDEGPYYVEGDSGYYVDSEPEYTGYSRSYASAQVYPYWSVDYFYLGSHHRHSNFSFGFSYGYPYNRGWYDPFYWSYYPYSYSYFDFYFPLRYSYWHIPFYGHSYNRYGWNDHYWRHRYNRHYGYNDSYDRWNRGHSDRDRYAGDHRSRNPNNPRTGPDGRDRNTYRDGDRYAGRDEARDRRRRAGEDGPVNPPPRSGGNPGPGGNANSAPMNRHTSVASGDRQNARGVEVRSRQERKPGKTKTEPVRPVTRLSPTPRVVQAPSQRRSPAYTSSRSPSGEVRSKAGSKEGRTRISPVESRTSPGIVRSDSQGVTRGSTRIVSSRAGNTTVRSPSRSKSTPVKTQPVRPQPARPQSSDSRKQGSVNRSTRSPVRTATPVQRQSQASRQHSSPRPSQRSAPAPRPAQSAPQKSRPASSGPSRSRSSGARPSSGKARSNPKPAKTEKKDRR